MADIVTNTLQIGSNNLVLRDADAQEQLVTVKDGLSDLEAQIIATLITDTASGAIASFPDGADNVPVKSLTVDIEPVQSGSGDPSPTNIRPISGHTSATVTRTGKNLLPLFSGEKSRSGITVKSEGGCYIVNGTAESLWDCGWNPNLRLGAGTYICTIDSAVQGIDVYVGTKSGFMQFTSDGREFVVNESETITYVFLRFNVGVSLTNVLVKPMIRPASDTDATFAPYQGQTVTIDLDGTRYGGTLNVETGVLTVDRKYRLLNGVNGDGVTYAQNGHTANTTRAFIRITDKAYGANNMISSSFFYQASGDSVGIMIGRAAGNGVEFFLNPSVPDTEEGVKAWFAENPTDLVYELAEPFTVQLTAEEVTTLKGTNNIWNDCGDTTVEYRADTKLYINKMLNA